MSVQFEPIQPEVADRDLERRVRGSLHTRSYAALRRLQVSAHGGTVTVAGRVPSFHEKQVALHSCRHVPGVRQLVDAVGVD